MKLITALFFILLMLGCDRPTPMTHQGRYDRAINELNAAKDARDRFYALNDATKGAFELGKTDEARKFATELEELSPSFKGDWNYGNAIQDLNIVLGRLVIDDGDIAEAEKHLIAAGRSPGSPQMDSFGPNMSLAKDLLEAGRKDVVLEYFKLCKVFWKMHGERLEEWAKDVEAGEIPDFGANLVY